MNATGTLITIVILAALAGGAWMLLADAEQGSAGNGDLVRERPVTIEGQTEGPPPEDHVVTPAPPLDEGRFRDPVDAPKLPPAVVVKVMDAGGQPTKGARVVLVQGNADVDAPGFGAALIDGTTDEGGRATLQPEGDEDWLVVVAEGYLPSAVAVAEGEEAIVVLTRGVTVSGFVRIGGVAPAAAVELAVTGFVDASADWSPALRRVRAALGRVHDGQLPARTVVDGGFAFRGLPSGVPLDLVFPRHRIVGADGARSRTLSITPPVEGKRVDLEPLPLITGLPVEPGGPINAEAAVTTKDGRTYRVFTGCVSGEPFELVLRGADASRAEVVLTRVDGSRFARRLVVTGLDGTVDLGEISADPLRTLPVRVTGPGGPISGARVAAAGYLSPPTDDEGWVDFRLPPETASIWIGAPGHQPISKKVPPETAGAVEVRLEKSSRLTVSVTGEAGATPGLRVRVTATGGPVLDDPSGGTFEVGGVLGTPSIERGFGADGSETLIFDVSAGAIDLYCLRDGVALTVTLSDAYGNIVRTAETSLPGAVHRTIGWTLDDQAHTAHLVVVDAAGNPLEGALIKLGEHHAAWRSDAEGRVTIEGLFADAIDLSATLEGYAKGSIAAARLDDTDITVALQSARVLWVTVHDAVGNPVDGATVAVVVDDVERAQGSASGRGLYKVAAAPLVTARVRVVAGDRKGDALVSVDDDRVTIVVR